MYYGNLGVIRVSPSSFATETAHWFFEVRLRRIISGTSSNRFLNFVNIGRTHFGNARRFGRAFRAQVSRASFRARHRPGTSACDIHCVARNFDACVWARGDRGRSHGIQREKLARIALAASLDAPRALRTGLRALEEAWDA